MDKQKLLEEMERLIKQAEYDIYYLEKAKMAKEAEVAWGRLKAYKQIKEMILK